MGAVGSIGAVVLAVALAPAAACSRSAWREAAAASDRQATVPQTAAAAADRVPAADVRHLHALLINGGSTPEQNFQSHLLQVQKLTELLLKAGLPRDAISIFSSDGADPAPDMAAREAQPEQSFWLLKGTPLEGMLRTPVDLASSTVPLMTPAPARAADLSRWFDEKGRKLRAGDTLLLYVTDHGTRDPKDPRNNRISLWGQDANLSVDALGAELAKLDPGVRVVALMSQCFSGGFARLYESRRAAGGRGGTCGYFSSTAERQAYGCYPENRGKDNVGHSFHFLDALARGRSFPAAHREVLVTDRTPDVPLRTSDAYIEDLLKQAAVAAGQPPERFADSLLAEAWRDRRTWEPELRLLERLGQTFGMWAPHTFAELETQAGGLPAFGTEVAERKRAWADGLQDLNVARLERFQERAPDWQQRLNPGLVAGLPRPERRALTAELLRGLEGFDLEREHLTVMHENAELAADLNYRMEVRLGVLLRVKALLREVAGRIYLSRRATAQQRQAYQDLVQCETLRLPRADHAAAGPPQPPAQPFPPFKDDVQLAQRLVPNYIGIEFAATTPADQKRHGLGRGATVVRNVYPRSPAEEAGLRPGDVIAGAEGNLFTEHNQIRVWSFFAPAKPQRMDVLRSGNEKVAVTITPRPRPGKLPSLPEPPKPETDAPALSVTPFRGKVPGSLKDGTSRLLFFWATYCGPCKSSLPEVMAFSRARNVPVVAITDEPPDTVTTFFDGWKAAFPENVALDDLRQTFIRYGVSGVPTFVLVDGQGKVRSQQTGYGGDTTPGLGVPGWRYQR